VEGQLQCAETVATAVANREVVGASFRASRAEGVTHRVAALGRPRTTG